MRQARADSITSTITVIHTHGYTRATGCGDSWSAAAAACGAVTECVDRVLQCSSSSSSSNAQGSNGSNRNGFCAVRPPGHHAGAELHCCSAASNGYVHHTTLCCAITYAIQYTSSVCMHVQTFDSVLAVVSVLHYESV
jgi:acetoin utilization deacetylase AcuC-like enzyme